VTTDGARNFIATLGRGFGPCACGNNRLRCPSASNELAGSHPHPPLPDEGVACACVLLRFQAQNESSRYVPFATDGKVTCSTNAYLADYCSIVPGCFSFVDCRYVKVDQRRHNAGSSFRFRHLEYHGIRLPDTIPCLQQQPKSAAVNSGLGDSVGRCHRRPRRLGS
jgi:hypothetical protein